ncbi:MAG: tetratricopeptide repeat protein, partial [Candidatus Aminicenantes bacterium]|nr:tetratricopeptide repeat protein [Candidatus Aminicenantes bacterium]
SCLINLGYFYFNNQDLWKSYNCFDRGKVIAEKGNFADEKPEIFFNLGIVSYCFGQYDLAEYYLEKSLQIYTKKQDLESIVSGLVALALSVYKNQKVNGLVHKTGKAEELLDQALQLSLKAGLKPLEARIINNLAYVYLDKDLDKAREYANQALNLGQNLNDKEVIAASFSNLAEVFLRKNQVSKAEDYFKKSLRIASASNYWTEVWNDYAGLARCDEKRGAFSLAITYYQKALKTLGKLRNNINLDLFRIGFDLEKKDVYEGIIRSLVNLKAKKNSAELEDLIFASVKEIKARVFLEEMLKHDDQNQLSELSKELWALEGNIMDLIVNHRNLPKNEIGAEIQELELRYLRSLASKNPSSNQSNYHHQPLTLQEVREECRRKNQVILDYYLGRDESYCFLINKDHCLIFKLVSEKGIEKSIKLYIKLLSKPEIPTEELRIASKKIRELLLPDEVLRALTGNRLVIIPDGLLH